MENTSREGWVGRHDLALEGVAERHRSGCPGGVRMSNTESGGPWYVGCRDG